MDKKSGLCGYCYAELYKKDSTSISAFPKNIKEKICRDDKYCKYCGRKNDRFIPLNENNDSGVSFPDGFLCATAYGPILTKRIHICKNCGYEWTTFLKWDEEKYCPECGGKSKYNYSGW